MLGTGTIVAVYAATAPQQFTTEPTPPGSSAPAHPTTHRPESPRPHVESPTHPVTPSETTPPPTESPLTAYEDSPQRNSAITKAASRFGRTVLKIFNPSNPTYREFDGYCGASNGDYLSQGAPIPANGSCTIQHNEYDDSLLVDVIVPTNSRRQIINNTQGVDISGGVNVDGSACYVSATLSDGRWNVQYSKTGPALPGSQLPTTFTKSEKRRCRCNSLYRCSNSIHR